VSGPRRDQTARHLRALFGAGTVAGYTDRQLLEMFASRGGEAAELAFAALVERHGPAVLRACLAVLRDRHDAEDAFQATFLVLARKAAGLRQPAALSGWLHGVALRVAARARSARGRRARHERACAGMAREATAPAGRDDLAAAVHEELGRLPERYRAAVVLCDLQDRSYAEAARELGCTPGTVGSRLARGRDRLRARLARRGLAPAAVAAALAAEADAAAPPAAALIATTAAAAARFAAGPAAVAAGAVPAAAAALAEGVLTAMFMTKLKAVAVVAAGLIALGAGALAQAPSKEGRDPFGPDAAPAPDRLREVEQKLDRLLRLFEGGQRPEGPRFRPPEANLDTLPEVPARPGRTADPSQQFEPKPDTVTDRPAPRANAPVTGRPNRTPGPGAVNGTPTSRAWRAEALDEQIGPVNDRVSRLEQRIEQIERRLDRLERGGPRPPYDADPLPPQPTPSAPAERRPAARK
jgi:RNA polymerase sigma factor (sigma-70 family)